MDLNALWDAWLALVEKNWFAVTFGAFVAAWAGTWGAQSFAERSKARSELLDELRATNAAVVIAVTVADWALSVKVQHVLGIAQNLRQVRQHFEEAERRHVQGPADVERFGVDLRAIHVGNAPTAALQTHLIGKVAAGPRALRFAISLSQSVEDLRRVCEERNALLREIQSRGLHDEQLLRIILGVPHRQGDVDRRYADYVQGMEMLCDSAVFFAVTLSEELASRSAELRRRFQRLYWWRAAPRRTRADFQEARAKGLVPSADEEPYKTFVANTRVEAQPRWWTVALRLLRRLF